MNSEFKKTVKINSKVLVQHIQNVDRDEILLLLPTSDAGTCVEYDHEERLHSVRFTRSTALKVALTLLRFYFGGSPATAHCYLQEQL